jgi:hypothetical protein
MAGTSPAMTPRGNDPHFVFALIAASASACVYSWLATPPFGIFGNSASKSVTPIGWILRCERDARSEAHIHATRIVSGCSP